MIETWEKGGKTITFATDNGTICNDSGKVMGFTRDELIFNGWKPVSFELDNNDEQWEDVPNEQEKEVEIEEIKPRQKSRKTRESK